MRPKTLTYRQIIDLSHTIHPQMPLWAGDPPVAFEQVAQLEQDSYFLRQFSMGEHSGTHMNAPNSFFADGQGIDAYTAASLVVPAVVINVQQQADVNPDYSLSQPDLLTWEQQHGKIPEGHLVVLYTGWQAKWPDRAAFLNLDAQGQPHFPGFSPEVTQFLLTDRAIAGIGIDTHGVDGGQDTTFATNRQVLAAGGIVLENLTQLDQLPPVGVTLAIGRLRLQGGSGSPVSVLAFVP